MDERRRGSRFCAVAEPGFLRPARLPGGLLHIAGSQIVQTVLQLLRGGGFESVQFPCQGAPVHRAVQTVLPQVLYVGGDHFVLGKSGMIDGYTQALQDNLGLSNSDAQAVRDSFSSILAEKEEAYRGALKQVPPLV